VSEREREREREREGGRETERERELVKDRIAQALDRGSKSSGVLGKWLFGNASAAKFHHTTNHIFRLIKRNCTSQNHIHHDGIINDSIASNKFCTKSGKR